MPPIQSRPIYLDKFKPDLNELIGKRLAFIGMTASGKSEAMKTLVFWLRNLCFGAFCHSPSEGAQQFWDTFIPKSFIYQEKSLERLQGVLDAQKKRAKFLKGLFKKGIISEQEAKRRGHIILILDDLMFLGKKFFSNELIKEIWTMGRHYFITVFLSLQYSKGVDPILRLNTDWVFIWKTQKLGERKKLFDEWVGYFKNFQTFDRVFDKVTGQYMCMVAKTSAGGDNELENNVFYWRPDRQGEFMIGDKEYREFHHMLCKEKKRHREIDVKTSRKRIKVL